MSTMRRAAAQASALKVSMPTWHKHRRGDSTHRVNCQTAAARRRHGALRLQVSDSSEGFDAMGLGITLLRTALAAVLGDAERLVGRDTWFGRHLRHSHTQGVVAGPHHCVKFLQGVAILYHHYSRSPRRRRQDRCLHARG
jgi:hypothetical protein